MTTAPIDRNSGSPVISGHSLLWPRCVSLLLLGVAFAICGLHPYWSVWLGLTSLLLFAVSACWTVTFFVLFPVLLVAADGYLLTGQMVIQESDSLLLASCAGGLWKGFRIGHRKVSRPLFWFGAIFVFSLFVSGYRGVAMLPATDFRDQLSVYFSSWNVLRISKGYLWGAAFMAMFIGSLINRGQAVRGLVLGFQLATFYVGLFVLAERLVFEGLWDFSQVMRATGPFATMHIGDQHLDAFLVIALPLAWYGTLMGNFRRSWPDSKSRLMSTASADSFGPRIRQQSNIGWTHYVWPGFLSVLIIHAGLSSMSRATIVVLLLQLLALASAGAWRLIRTRSRDWLFRATLTIFAGLGLVVIVATFAARSDAISNRFKASQADFWVRWDHWSKCIELTHAQTTSLVLGRGMGTLPTVVAEASGRSTPPVRWESDASGGTGRVIMLPGWPLYFEHWMLSPCDSELDVSVEASAPTALGTSVSSITILRCSKSLLEAYQCQAERRAIPAAAFENLEMTLAPPNDGGSSEPLLSNWRPQSLGIYVDGDCQVELHGIGVHCASSSQSMSRQDNFGDGAAGWVFSCDDHLVWRSKNIWVHVLLEQGWLGLLALSGLQLAIMYQCIRGNGLAEIDRGAVAISLIGFAAVGSFGTLVDTPWILGLLLSVVAVLSVAVNTKDEQSSPYTVL